MRRQVESKCLEGLNAWLAEPIQDCLARENDDHPCIESKSPVDIERELGHYRGNIFHGALSFPLPNRRKKSGRGRGNRISERIHLRRKRATRRWGKWDTGTQRGDENNQRGETIGIASTALR